MTKRQTLNAQKREILGKKVKQLRQKGVLPANVFGKKVRSLTLEVDQSQFRKLLSRIGETEVLDLKVKGEKAPRPVLIHHTQIDPVNGQLLHADFLQVDLAEKVVVAVPLKFVGESPAVKEGRGVLLELKSEVEVEALPTDLPSEIEIDMSGLSKINDFVAVKDLKLPKGVEMKGNPNDLVVKIESPQKEATEKEEKEEEIIKEGAMPAGEAGEKVSKNKEAGKGKGAESEETAS